DNLKVIGYSDLEFFSCVDSQKSTSGYIFMFVGKAVSWKSVKQTLTATSTMEAEFVSCFEATSLDPLTKGMPPHKFKDHAVAMEIVPT
ncbi:hypothetical protein ES288_A08G103300v1, partial [Gossypium darwinii]